MPAEIPAEGGPEEGELEEDMAIDGEDEHGEEKTSVMMTRARARAAAASGGTTTVTAPVTPPVE